MVSRLLDPADEIVMLPATPDAAARARQVVATATGDLPVAVRDDAQLLVSELVGNSVRHGEGPVTLRVRRLARAVRVEVGDHGAGPVLPTPSAPPARQPHGRGLLIVDVIASAWGTTGVPGAGKTVWFELAV